MHLPHEEAVKYAMRASSASRDLENHLAKIRQFKGSEKNKRLILDYDRLCSTNGNKLGTRNATLAVLRHLQQFAKDKSLRQFTKEDIISFFELEKRRRFDDTRYKRKHGRPAQDVVMESTLNLRRHLIRKFFAYVHGYQKGYPPVVDWMKVKRIGRDKSRRINPSDLLTPEEIYTIISHAESPRDRALLSLLAESGCRVGEVSTLRVSDVVFNEKGVEVTVNGKTGPRTVPLVVSKPDLENWLNNFHMFAARPEAPLFPRFDRKQLQLNLHTDGIWNVVKKTVARARLVRTSLQAKNVTPHSFRHARATELSRLGWTEAMLRAYFGWTEDSTMPSVYIHLSQSDVGKRYYRMYGKAGAEDEVPRKLEENRSCPHCGIRNPTGYITCFSCGLPINRKITTRIERQQEVTDTLNFIAKDSELSKKLLQLVVEAKEKQECYPEMGHSV